MKIEYSSAKIADLLSKGRKKIFSIAIIAFTLVITLIIHRAQSKKIVEIGAKKSAELKSNEVLTEIAQSQKKIDLYKKTFRKKDAFWVAEAISDIARESKVNLISIRPEKEERYPLYSKYLFSLTVGTDDYHPIGKFINKLEEHPEVFFVDALDMKSQQVKEAGQPHKLIVNITMSIIEFKG